MGRISSVECLDPYFEDDGRDEHQQADAHHRDGGRTDEGDHQLGHRAVDGPQRQVVEERQDQEGQGQPDRHIHGRAPALRRPVGHIRRGQREAEGRDVIAGHEGQRDLDVQAGGQGQRDDGQGEKAGDNRFRLRPGHAAEHLRHCKALRRDGPRRLDDEDEQADRYADEGTHQRLGRDDAQHVGGGVRYGRHLVDDHGGNDGRQGQRPAQLYPRRD